MRTVERSLRFICVVSVIPAMLVGCGSLPVGAFPDVVPFSVAATESSAPEAGAPLPSDDCMMLGEPSTETHKQLFEALNEFRVSHGLEPLVYSLRLEMAADAHVRDLYEREFFAHVNPDGDNPGKRAIQAGFCHEYVGENIAAGQKTVAAAQKAWENSPSHYNNMMQPAYRYVGVGVFQDPTGRMYWGQNMAYHLP